MEGLVDGLVTFLLVIPPLIGNDEEADWENYTQKVFENFQRSRLTKDIVLQVTTEKETTEKETSREVDRLVIQDLLG